MITEKKCTECGDIKPLEQFYRESANKTDGRKRICKDCIGSYNQRPEVRYARRKNNLSYYRNSIGKITQRLYRQSDAGKLSQKRYLHNHPNKRKAQVAVQIAVQSGNLVKTSTQTCTDCGEHSEHYHHESYDKKDWLNVIPLCALCHKQRHG